MDEYVRPLPDEPMPLDLLNTELLVDGRRVDLLSQPSGLDHWLGLHGLSTRPGPDVLARLIEARSAIRAVLERGDRAAALLNEVLDHVRIRVGLTVDGPVREIETDEAAWLPAGTAAVGLLELLPHLDRVRCCAHPRCVLWFLDTSKNGTRRWHSMATCGNRSKAQAHATRRRRAQEA